MLTQEQAPWVSYLDIDEKTGKGILRDDAPEEIKKQYDEYLKNLKREKMDHEPIEK